MQQQTNMLGFCLTIGRHYFIKKIKMKRYSYPLLCLCFFLWFTPFVPSLKWGHIETTRWQKDKGQTQLQLKLDQLIKTEKISPYAIYATIAAEDYHFFRHRGFNLQAIINSIHHNYKQNRYAVGASTITQQVIKLTLLSPEKNIIRNV